MASGGGGDPSGLDDGKKSEGSSNERHEVPQCSSGAYDFSFIESALNDPYTKEMAGQIARDPAFNQMDEQLQKDAHTAGHETMQRVMKNPQFITKEEHLGNNLMQCPDPMIKYWSDPETLRIGQAMGTAMPFGNAYSAEPYVIEEIEEEDGLIVDLTASNGDDELTTASNKWKFSSWSSTVDAPATSGSHVPASASGSLVCSSYDMGGPSLTTFDQPTTAMEIEIEKKKKIDIAIQRYREKRKHRRFEKQVVYKHTKEIDGKMKRVKRRLVKPSDTLSGPY